MNGNQSHHTQLLIRYPTGLPHIIHTSAQREREKHYIVHNLFKMHRSPPYKKCGTSSSFAPGQPE